MPKKKKSTEVAKVKSSEEAKPTVWSKDQIELIKNTVAKDATDDELKLFLYTASRTGLDPLTRQIFFVKRAGRVTIQTGIDGYRAIAERTGQLAGIDDPTYELGETGLPIKATVSVYRVVKNTRVPFTASARWNEYVPQGGQSFMWQKMPFLMLGKVAESLALRKAFPLNLSGLYTQEEMQQAENPIMEMNALPRPILDKKEYPQGDYAEDSFDNMENIEIANKEPQPIKHTPIKVSDKTKITYLIKVLKITEPLPEKIRAITGLEFIEENYPEIINRLEDIYRDSKENN